MKHLSGKKLSEKIRSMTAKEIILAMVDSLENPVCEIDMDTFGTIHNQTCYGCAATNTIAKLAGIKELTVDLWNVDYYNEGEEFELTELFEEEYRGTQSLCIRTFERAIDHLRQGDFDAYNRDALFGGFAVIKWSPEMNIDLPILETQFTDDDLEYYRKLAIRQD